MRQGIGVADGGFARVTTDYGQCTLRVAVSERQQRGMLFAPIHWSEDTASAARVGALVAPFTDPFSGQPENKATPASIAPYEYVFRGFALVAGAAGIARPCLVDARGRDRRLRLSVRRQCRSGGMAILAAVGRRQRSRRIQGFRRRRLSRGVVCRQIASKPACSSVRRGTPATGMWSRACSPPETLSDDQRRMLLSGKSADGLASAGPIVCACFGVGRTTICDAIAAGAGTAAEIGVQLKAGTNCGSCIPEMKRLIAQANVRNAGADPEQRQVARAAN